MTAIPTSFSAPAVSNVWDDLAGQDRATSQLRRAAEGIDSMAHAWLITGPPGSGRSNAARAFAAALQCTKEPPGCGRCHDCLTTLGGTHPDVRLVATEKLSIRIAEVRSLVELAQRSPSRGRRRVILIEDADRMSEGTFNVLLKAIEEPPEKTVWLLCAPSAEDLAPTVRSRCRSVTLRIPPAHDVAELLIRRDGVEPEIADFVARAAQSHIGVARRLARDPVARERRARTVAIPFAIRSVGEAVVRAGELVELANGEAKSSTEERNADEKAELLRSLGVENATLPPALRSQLKQLEEDQKRRVTRTTRDVLDRTMIDLYSVLRDVLVTQLDTGLELVNPDRDDDIRRRAADTSPERTLRMLEAIGAARARIAANVQPLLAFEAMLVSFVVDS